MSKEIIFEADARERLKAGVDKLANAVKVTLGARNLTSEEFTNVLRTFHFQNV